MSESKPEKLPPMRERVALGTAIGELYPQVQQGRNARQRSIAEKLPQPTASSVSGTWQSSDETIILKRTCSMWHLNATEISRRLWL